MEATAAGTPSAKLGDGNEQLSRFTARLGGESETLEGSAAASETGTEMSSPPGWLQNKAPHLCVELHVWSPLVLLLICDFSFYLSFSVLWTI